MNIIYILSKFPSVTHTFVYREIEALKKAGHKIVTVGTVKPVADEVSHEAFDHYRNTLYLNQVGIVRKLVSQIMILCRCPCKWFKLLLTALKENEVQSIRDRFRIIYHFMEAGYLFLKIDTERFEHIHSHFLTGPTSIALFLSRYMDISFSFTMHASLIYVDPIMLRTKLEMCKNAITISKYNKDYLIRKYGDGYSEKIKIIHCGIELDKFKPTDTREEEISHILAVGQLAERKGFCYLLDACNILHKKGYAFVCDIVGDGELKEQLEKRIFLHRLDEIVRLLGRQPQETIRKMLERTSIFVLPSIITENGGREGIPVALMEAMAMEIPVVSTSTVGIPELIESGKEGLLVGQKNAVALAEAIETLLKDQSLRIEMGINGRKKVERDFNINRLPEAFKEVF